jgi:hypothetical protein
MSAGFKVSNEEGAWNSPKSVLPPISSIRNIFEFGSLSHPIGLQLKEIIFTLT